MSSFYSVPDSILGCYERRVNVNDTHRGWGRWANRAAATREFQGASDLTDTQVTREDT